MKKASNILMTHEKELYKAEKTHFLQNPTAKAAFVLFCIAADGYTLFSVFDCLLTQDWVLSLFITAVVAAALNVTPMLLAASLRNDELSKDMKTILGGLLFGVFAMLFITCFALRLTTADAMFTDSGGLNIVGDTMQVTEDTHHTAAEYAVLILLGLEPLATSACTFFISYEDTTKRKKRLVKALGAIRLQDEIDRLSVEREEIRDEMSYDLEGYDQDCYDAHREIMEADAELLKIKSRQILSKKVGTPEGISYLMEKGHQHDESESEP